MTVHVHFYSYFRDLTGCAETTAELPDGALLGALLEHLHERYPKLVSMKRSTLVAVGVEYQGPDHPLQNDDHVSLFPPVQGG